ncbi:hypothetical protein C2S51_024817 [Perilla frutescens var. frutescens]|nr:hypothetical protein C2S51_024817 [Perilla frutescens var. frutescens]
METMFDSDPDPTRQELEGQEDDNDINFLDQSTPPSTLFHLQDPNMQQQLAAKCIQTVVRGYLARRAFRALKGLSRLQFLANGHTVKRQAAIALHCIQALVKVPIVSDTIYYKVITSFLSFLISGHYTAKQSAACSKAIAFIWPEDFLET